MFSYLYLIGGNISTNWLYLGEGEDITESIVTLNMGHVLQALIGCRRLPTNMMKGAGTIEFDHIQSRLTTANTCAPSLCLGSTKLLHDYQELEKHIIHIITETDGFGIAWNFLYSDTIFRGYLVSECYNVRVYMFNLPNPAWKSYFSQIMKQQIKSLIVWTTTNK